MDFKLKGEFSSFGAIFLKADRANLLRFDEIKPIVEKYTMLQQMRDESDEETRMAIFDVCLRGLRISYGFLNTLLIMVLTKPFHEPLIAVKNKIKMAFQKLI